VGVSAVGKGLGGCQDSREVGKTRKHVVDMVVGLCAPDTVAFV